MASDNTFYLKLKTKDKNFELKGEQLSADSSTTELRSKISQVTLIPETLLRVLHGYPRKVVRFSDSTSIEKCDIKCGDTLLVEESTASSEEVSEIGATCASASASAVDSVPKSTSNSRDATTTTTTTTTTLPVPSVRKQHVTTDNSSREMRGNFLKKEVPSDNSCLFTSLGFVLSGRIDPTVNTLMRQLVANTIAAQPEEYSDAILGKANQEYCSWIVNPNSWGGAIELAVLSNYYGFEIAVVNSTTGIISRFGEDKQYEQRVFLLFDGIHYDPLYMDFIESENIQTIFPTSDEQILRDAEQVAFEAKESKQYTDVNQFMICCTICNAILVGQLEAQQHAEQTGHTKFDEVVG